MADQKRITLRQGEATPKNIRLHPLPVADAAATTTIYLTEFDATPKNIILRNPATAPVTGAETGESAAPLSATGVITAAGRKGAASAAPVAGVAAITAGGRKGASSAAPLAATGIVTALGREGHASAAPLSATGAITAAGQKSASSAAPISAVGVVTASGLEGEGSAAPLSAVGSIAAAGLKGASAAAPLSATGTITSVGEAAATAPVSTGGHYSPATKTKWRTNRDEIEELVRAVHSALAQPSPAPKTLKAIERRAAHYDLPPAPKADDSRKEIHAALERIEAALDNLQQKIAQDDDDMEVVTLLIAA